MLKAKDGDFVVKDWLRNRNTLEFLGIWEKVYNPDFNWGEFALIRNQAGLNRFRISVKEYVEKTNAIGLKARAGRYGGTYAHKDIAFEFAMWISPEFKVYLVRDFQRLKEQEQARLGWSAKRELTKINYRIHTDAVQQNLIPKELTPAQASRIYADEADVLNVAMFGMTAREWRDANPGKKGNIRDYASINELICLSNMENLNSVFISESRPNGTAVTAKPDRHAANGDFRNRPGKQGAEITKKGYPTGIAFLNVYIFKKFVERYIIVFAQPLKGGKGNIFPRSLKVAHIQPGFRRYCFLQ